LQVLGDRLARIQRHARRRQQNRGRYQPDPRRTQAEGFEMHLHGHLIGQFH
jgi:hypothetical protein